MFCEKCGNLLEEGDAFCNECGAKCPQPDLHEANEKADAYVPEQQSENVNVTPDASENARTNGGEYSAHAPKKSFTDKLLEKKKLLGGVVAAIVVLVGVTSFFPVVKNTVVRMFTSPEKYMQIVVGNEAGAIIKTFTNVYGKGIDYLIDGSKESGKISVKLDKKLPETIEEVSGLDVSDAIGWLERAEIDFSAVMKDNKSGADMNVSLNKTELGKIELLQDFDEGEMFIAIPDYNSKYLMTELDSYLTSEMELLQKVVKALPDEKLMKKLLNKYVVSVLEGVNDVEESDYEISADGISQKVTKLSVDIDGGIILSVMKNVLEEAREDAQIKKTIRDVSYAVEAEVDVDEYTEAIDEILENLEDMDEDDLYYDEIKLDIYVNNRGEIAGFKIKTEDDVTVRAYTVRKGSKFASRYEIKTPYDGTYGIYGNGKQSGNKRTGTYEVKAGSGSVSASIVEIEVEKLDLKLLEDGFVNCTAEIKFSEGIMDMLSLGYYYDSSLSDTIVSLLDDVSLTVKSDISSLDKGSVEMMLNYEDKSIATIECSAKYGKGKQVNMPSESKAIDMTDSDEMEEWIENVKFNDFIKKIRKAGVPEDYVEMIEEALEELE